MTEFIWLGIAVASAMLAAASVPLAGSRRFIAVPARARKKSCNLPAVK